MNQSILICSSSILAYGSIVLFRILCSINLHFGASNIKEQLLGTQSIYKTPPETTRIVTVQTYQVNEHAEFPGLNNKPTPAHRGQSTPLKKIRRPFFFSKRSKASFRAPRRGAYSQKSPPPSASNLLNCSAASHEWRLFKSPPSAPGNSFFCGIFWVLGLRRDPILASPAPAAPGGSPGASFPADAAEK